MEETTHLFIQHPLAANQLISVILPKFYTEFDVLQAARAVEPELFPYHRTTFIRLDTDNPLLRTNVRGLSNETIIGSIVNTDTSVQMIRSNAFPGFKNYEFRICLKDHIKEAVHDTDEPVEDYLLRHNMELSVHYTASTQKYSLFIQSQSNGRMDYYSTMLSQIDASHLATELSRSIPMSGVILAEGDRRRPFEFTSTLTLTEHAVADICSSILHA